MYTRYLYVYTNWGPWAVATDVSTTGPALNIISNLFHF
jgi:hypothetical protein